VGEAAHSARLVRFGVFEVDLQAGELRKSGVKLKLTGQPFQVLTILLDRPGEVVSREELQNRLWPDTFVDAEHNLNTAINKIREVLGDSAENPRFVETLPRRGYRFIAPVQNEQPVVRLQITPAKNLGASPRGKSRWRSRLLYSLAVGITFTLVASAALLGYKKLHSPVSRHQTLTRLTFDEGLQIGATWSPDGRFIAYSSDRGGKFDIWVQQVTGGNPIQLTQSETTSWQPDWSPDGKYLVYRSEDGEGGLFVAPALGGAGFERKVTSFGYYPRWSPDGSQILFQRDSSGDVGRLYVVGLDGGEPREVLTNFLAAFQHRHSIRSAAWHPDGQRITLWAWGNVPLPTFWTVPIAGGEGIESRVDPEALGYRSDQGRVSRTFSQWQVDRKFSWDSSGRAIYFECSTRGSRNLWKLKLDPKTLRTLAVERLTTGPALDTDLALSPDGKELAFTGKSEHLRIWRFPFDSVRGQLRGPGQAVTSSGMEAWFHTLTRDGKKLAFSAIRAGRPELWESFLVDRREALIIADGYARAFPQWSPDGNRLAYWRATSMTTDEGQLLLWSSDNRKEEPASAPTTLQTVAYDWSPDGTSLLISQENSSSHLAEIWLLPVTGMASSQPIAKKVISDPDYDLWQPHFSPNGHWIVFLASRETPTGGESKLYVTDASNGSKIPITDGKYLDDKPRWSPDGRAIYFVSDRRGFCNVWGIRFDPTKGRVIGEPFRVTKFESPALMLPNEIIPVEISLDHDSLFVNLTEASGSIWMLDHVSP